MTVYQPAEDTEFFLEYLTSLKTSGKLLEIGTGSGKIAVEMSKEGWEVKAVDTNPEAVEEARKRAQDEEADIEVRESDLFANIKDQFDLIIFNPPYLPGEEMEDDETWRGGKKGIEVTERFLEKVEGYFEKGGRAVFIASSLAELEQLEYDIRVLEERKLWFETLYIMEFK